MESDGWPTQATLISQSFLNVNQLIGRPANLYLFESILLHSHSCMYERLAECVVPTYSSSKTARFLIYTAVVLVSGSSSSSCCINNSSNGNSSSSSGGSSGGGGGGGGS